jgi:TPR repeat protein
MRSNKSTMLGSMLLVALIGSAQAGPYEQALLAKDSGDFSKARTVLQPLALQGDANSQFQLSLLLRNGQGGPVDNQGAIKWLRLAANQGHASAQSNLGAAYSRGWGVPQNAVRAVVWFTLAAASGSKEAQTNREVALRRMTLQDISQANDIAKDCLQKNLNSCD